MSVRCLLLLTLRYGHTMALLSCGSSGGGSGGGSSYYGRAVVFGGTSQHGTQTVAFNDLYVMDVMAASVDAGLALRWTRVVVVGRGGLTGPIPSKQACHGGCGGWRGR